MNRYAGLVFFKIAIRVVITRRSIDSVAVDRGVDIRCDGMTQFFSDVTEQPGRPRKQGHAPQHLRR